VENVNTKQRYTQLIDRNFIVGRETFDCFGNTISLYDALVDNFAKVVVERGVINYIHNWGKVIK
jgi:hypothetical protein